MKSRRKGSKSWEIEVFNTELIYSRVMYLLSTGEWEELKNMNHNQ